MIGGHKMRNCIKGSQASERLRTTVLRAATGSKNYDQCIFGLAQWRTKDSTIQSVDLEFEASKCYTQNWFVFLGEKKA